MLSEKIKQYLKLLAPYIAVVMFWRVWPNAWLAILVYHAQILFWNRVVWREIRPLQERKRLLLAVPAVFAGPLLYILLPFITLTDIPDWLGSYRLSGLFLIIMIPYFGIVHPVLEQVHWRQLRKDSAWSHVIFAGYHMIVLSSLLSIPWLILCFVVLAGASFAWKLMERIGGSITVPVVSHILADLGIVLAAWARTR